MTDDSIRGEKPRKRPTPRKLMLALIAPLLGFCGFWFVFMRPMEERDKLREEGIKVPGRLLDVETTGNRYNKSPELELTMEFTRKDGVLDTATSRFVPKRRFIGLYQPGAAVTVAYDSADPNRVTVAEIFEETEDDHGAGAHPQANVDSLRRVTDSLRRAADSIAKGAR